jgi:hypothetical protein
VTPPLNNVSLAECFNASKGNVKGKGLFMIVAQTLVQDGMKGAQPIVFIPGLDPFCAYFSSATST